MKGPLLPESAHLDPSSGSAKASPGLYRKSIKTLIEKKRRTRINASLDQLKELLQSNEGSKIEKASRLEKADILELAVKHLQRLKRAANYDPIRGFTAGYSHCQSTVSSFFRPGEMSESKLKSQLLQNLEFQCNSAKKSTHPLQSSELSAASPLPWNAQAACSSHRQREAPLGPMNMDCDRFLSEESILSSRLQADHTLFFLRAPSSHSFSDITPGLPSANHEKTHDLLPGLASHRTFPASEGCTRQCTCDSRVPPLTNPAPQPSLPACTVADSDSTLRCQMELHITQDSQNGPRFLPGAEMSAPLPQHLPTVPSRVWRPW